MLFSSRMTNRQKLFTIKQSIKRLKIKFYIALGILVTMISATILVFAFEFNRVTHLSYNDIAEARIMNSGIQRKNFVKTYVYMAYQDITYLRGVAESTDLEDTSGQIDYTKLYTLLNDSTYYPYFLDDLGVIVDNNAIFSENKHFEIKNINITKELMLKGYEVNDATDENLYFIIPVDEPMPVGIRGFIGQIPINKFTEYIGVTIYNNESTTLIVRSNGDIICFSSGVHRWRFDDFFGQKFTNLTSAMRVWVNDYDFDHYLDFMNNDTECVFNAGENDRDGMFYKVKLDAGDETSDYYLVFMAPKNLLTNQTVTLANIALGAFYSSIALGTIIVILLSLGIIRITIRRKNENAFDQKTGLHREDYFFHDALAIILQHPNEKFGIVYLNIKSFAKINSYFGAIAGDIILDQVGKALQESIDGQTDDIAGYQHGDKYMLLLKGDYNEILFKLNEINDRLLSYPYEYAAKLTFSFGTKMTDAQYAIDLRSEFDYAKYCESNHSGNEIFNVYDEEMISKQKERDDLNGRFDEAIDNEEFEVFLQLKWSLKNNDWAGAEALCRWRDPIKGLISPGKFIPLFEENGKIVKLDAYMFEQTCKILRKMLDNGERCVPVSFNLSKRNFQDLSFMDKYQEIIEKYGIPHELIEIEITEGLIIDNIESFTTFIKIFHENDFNISMDDFGAGYSSLNMIHQLDFDVIKIDAKFFRGGFDEANQIIVTSIINLCHQLNKIVVAEGIENANEVEFLRKAECDIIQGYYFAKPLPVDEFKTLLFNNPENK